MCSVRKAYQISSFYSSSSSIVAVCDLCLAFGPSMLPFFSLQIFSVLILFLSKICHKVVIYMLISHFSFHNSHCEHLLVVRRRMPLSIFVGARTLCVMRSFLAVMMNEPESARAREIETKVKLHVLSIEEVISNVKRA